jgi:polyhydroxyalkanoate synthesis regulator phasin
MPNVEITPQQMYDLLLKVDRTVTQMASAQDSHARTLEDHEDRLRMIEAEEDFGRRFGELEADIKALREQISELQRKVWAIPGAATAIAAGALIFTLVRTY